MERTGSESSPLVLLKVGAICLVALSCPAAVFGQAGSWVPVGPEGGTVTVFRRDPHDPLRAYLGTHFGGMYQSFDNGSSWEHVASPFSRSAVLDIALDPETPGIIYVSVFEDGVYRSADGGASWEQRNQGLTDLIANTLVVHPTRPDELFAGTFSGLFKSLDGGETWFLLNPELPAQVLIFDPVTDGVMYAGSLIDDAGVLRSTDDGDSWELFNQGLSEGVLSLRFDAQTGTHLYAMTAGARAYRRRAGDASWSDISGNLGLVGDVLPYPLANQFLFAATTNGVFVSPDDGDNWLESIALSAERERPRWLSSDAFGSTIHLATLRGPGVLASNDFGTTWFESNSGLQNLYIGGIGLAPGPGGTAVFAGSIGLYAKRPGEEWRWRLTDLEINDVAAHPANPELVYAATLKDGIWTSLDGGDSWSQTSDGIFPWAIYDIAQASTPPHPIYAATSFGFYVSRDNGASWDNKVLVTHLPADVYSVAIDPTDPDVAYFAAEGVLYKTIDGTATEDGTFVLPASGLPSDFAFRQIEAINNDGIDRVYGVTFDGALFESSDQGESWTDAGPAGVFVHAVGVEPSTPRVLFLGTDAGLYKRDDPDGVFVEKASGLGRTPVIALALDPNSPDIIFAGTETGVFRSTDGGESWSDSSLGLPGSRVSNLTVEPSGAGIVYASLADAGVYRSADGGLSWSAVPGAGLFPSGDLPLLVHPIFNSILYTATIGLGVQVSFDAGASWFPSNQGMSLWVRRIAVHPAEPNIIYAAALVGGVFKTEDGGESWMNVGLVDNYMMDVAVDPTDTNTVYIATTGGIQRTTDGGASWQHYGGDTFFMSFAIDPKTPSTIYAGTEGSGLMKSTNGGVHWFSINNGFIGDGSAYAMALDPENPFTVYAGTVFNGVYITEDGGATWNELNDGLFHTFILDIAIDPSDPRTIYVGTEGGGMFRLTRP